MLRPDPPPRLPRGFGWLIRLAPETAGLGGQLRHLLADPEMAALLAAAPRLGKTLRPLCRMLGLDTAPDLPPALVSPPTRPPPARVARPAHGTPSQPADISVRFLFPQRPARA